MLGWKIKDTEPCPCGSNKAYKECCKNATEAAPNASKKPPEVQVMEKMRASMEKCCLYPDQTSCKGKIKEAQEILEDYEIIPMNEIGIDIDVEEDQETFEGNARKKAETIAKTLNGKMCLADDSGIQIEFLDGFPGVFTKRWHKGTDRERNEALIEKLNGVLHEKRKIKFVTAMALSDGEKTITAVGEIQGYVADAPRGENGFGFDEIFELEDGRTLAEISAEEKNQISARKKALENLKEKLKN